MSHSRLLCRATAWLYIVCLTLQVYLAGLAISGRITFRHHAMLGMAMILVALLMVVFTFLSRASGRVKWIAAAIVIITVLQPILIGLRATMPLVAGLHPVSALVLLAFASLVGKER